MDYIYAVGEYYNNGEWDEDECDCFSTIRAFATKEETEQFIREMDVPIASYPEKESYFEVFEGDELFIKYCSVYGEQFLRYFLHKVRETYNGKPVYENLAYFIKEIPFGNANNK